MKLFSLGDPISNGGLVSKMLRSLPERLNIKICAIDEARDTTTIALDDLISSLHTFELNLNLQRKDKEKTIALQVSDESYKDILQNSEEVNKSDLGEDSISLITKKFGDYLKRMRDKKKTSQAPKFTNVSTPDKPQRSINFRGQFQPRIEGTNQGEPKNWNLFNVRSAWGMVIMSMNVLIDFEKTRATMSR